jgi:hypothetical protein
MAFIHPPVQISLALSFLVVLLSFPMSLLPSSTAHLLIIFPLLLPPSPLFIQSPWAFTKIGVGISGWPDQFPPPPPAGGWNGPGWREEGE